MENQPATLSADRPGSVTFSQITSLLIIALLAGNLYVFGRIAAGMNRIVQQLEARTFTDAAFTAAPAQQAPNTATASGNVVHVATGDSALPEGPRTVEQVAAYLGVTPDTVRESYIPDWIESGLMTPEDRSENRWMIPDGFTPYRTK
jgi:hypothetical protein